MKKFLELLTASGEDLPEPEEIRRKYGKDLSEERFNFLMAVMAVKNSVAPWKEFHIFEKVVKGLNFKIPEFDKIEGCRPEEIWYALRMMKIIWPKAQFSEEILEYIRRVSNDFGLFVYPPQLGFSEDDKIEAEVKDRAESGPFPLGSTFVERQAAEYLAIQLYIKEMETSTDYSWL